MASDAVKAALLDSQALLSVISEAILTLVAALLGDSPFTKSSFWPISACREGLKTANSGRRLDAPLLTFINLKSDNLSFLLFISRVVP
ncbi:hypothetical protein GIV47_19530 [Pseudomonas marginalis]|uniref:hypothetical protein n=1 Tax=Pseudomonas marginalis TaxID=298 RepID=UPI001F46C848|nr:hypothetical protein [Pseudomonas marginalis]MCF5667150.1 hypothetical protein [Pseudomonas marginalis]